MLIRTLLCICCLLWFSGQIACTQKSVDIHGYKEQVIRFGRGGGVTGIKSEYVLLNDGRIFQKEPFADSLSYNCRVMQKKKTAAFSDFDKISKNAVNSPGDMYYYVTRIKEGNESHMVWGDRNTEVDSALTTYWNQLISLVKIH